VPFSCLRRLQSGNERPLPATPLPPSRLASARPTQPFPCALHSLVALRVPPVHAGGEGANVARPGVHAEAQAGTREAQEPPQAGQAQGLETEAPGGRGVRARGRRRAGDCAGRGWGARAGGARGGARRVPRHGGLERLALAGRRRGGTLHRGSVPPCPCGPNRSYSLCRGTRPRWCRRPSPWTEWEGRG